MNIVHLLYIVYCLFKKNINIDIHIQILWLYPIFGLNRFKGSDDVFNLIIYTIRLEYTTNVLCSQEVNLQLVFLHLPQPKAGLQVRGSLHPQYRRRLSPQETAVVLDSLPSRWVRNHRQAQPQDSQVPQSCGQFEEAEGHPSLPEEKVSEMFVNYHVFI